MTGTRIIENGLFPLAVFLCATWLLVMMNQHVVPPDPGDGVMHFQIAQATWHAPIHFLDHWGKPLFCLLTSPFAQLGFNGVVVFNVLVFIGSMFVAQRLMNHLKVNPWLQALFPVVLLNAYDYSLTLLAGLTEPLFNLLVLATALLLLKKKWVWLAIVASFLPFSRSEGQLPLLLIGLILVYKKEYKALPFLLTGFILYSSIGAVVFGDFWWYFSKSPYSMDNGIYGSGTWDHYLTSYRNYLGNPGLYILILGIPTAVVFIIRRKWEWLAPNLTCYAYGVFLGVLIAHSYFWATGQNGSMGLTRIATQGMPLFIVVHISFIGRISWMNTLAAKGIFLAGTVLIAWSAIRARHFPVPAGGMEQLLSQSADFLQKQTVSTQRIYYYHPLFAYFSDSNPLISPSKTTQYYGQNIEQDVKTNFHTGDVIVWDSHFGPSEMHLTLEKLEQIKELVLIKQLVSDPFEVRIYQFIPEDVDSMKGQR